MASPPLLPGLPLLPNPLLGSAGHQRFGESLPDDPRIRGRLELGRGARSVTLDGGKDEVLKILACPASYLFLTDPTGPKGPHFPEVFEDCGVIGETRDGYPLHLLRMERLFPLVGPSAALEMARHLQNGYFEACQAWWGFSEDMGRLALSSMARAASPYWPESVRDALRGLERFLDEVRAEPDLLHLSNMMMRADGTLVLSDPVFI